MVSQTEILKQQQRALRSKPTSKKDEIISTTEKEQEEIVKVSKPLTDKEKIDKKIEELKKEKERKEREMNISVRMARDLGLGSSTIERREKSVSDYAKAMSEQIKQLESSKAKIKEGYSAESIIGYSLGKAQSIISSREKREDLRRQAIQEAKTKKQQQLKEMGFESEAEYKKALKEQKKKVEESEKISLSQPKNIFEQQIAFSKLSPKQQIESSKDFITGFSTTEDIGGFGRTMPSGDVQQFGRPIISSDEAKGLSKEERERFTVIPEKTTTKNAIDIVTGLPMQKTAPRGVRDEFKDVFATGFDYGKEKASAGIEYVAELKPVKGFLGLKATEKNFDVPLIGDVTFFKGSGKEDLTLGETLSGISFVTQEGIEDVSKKGGEFFSKRAFGVPGLGQIEKVKGFEQDIAGKNKFLDVFLGVEKLSEKEIKKREKERAKQIESGLGFGLGVGAYSYATVPLLVGDVSRGFGEIQAPEKQYEYKPEYYKEYEKSFEEGIKKGEINPETDRKLTEEEFKPIIKEQGISNIRKQGISRAGFGLFFLGTIGAVKATRFARQDILVGKITPKTERVVATGVGEKGKIIQVGLQYTPEEYLLYQKRYKKFYQDAFKKYPQFGDVSKYDKIITTKPRLDITKTTPFKVTSEGDIIPPALIKQKRAGAKMFKVSEFEGSSKEILGETGKSFKEISKAQQEGFKKLLGTSDDLILTPEKYRYDVGQIITTKKLKVSPTTKRITLYPETGKVTQRFESAMISTKKPVFTTDKADIFRGRGIVKDTTKTLNIPTKGQREFESLILFQKPSKDVQSFFTVKGGEAATKQIQKSSASLVSKMPKVKIKPPKKVISPTKMKITTVPLSQISGVVSGVGFAETTIPKKDVKSAGSFKNIILESPRTKDIEKELQTLDVRTLLKEKQVSQQKPLGITKTIDFEKEGIGLKEGLTEKQITKQVSINDQVTSPTPITSFFLTRPKTIPTTTKKGFIPIPRIPGFNGKMPIKKQEPHDLFIKRGKKFKKVSNNITKEQALNLGGYLVDNSLSAQFKIKKSKGKIKKPKHKIPENYWSSSSTKFRPYKVKKGVKKPLVNQYIEKASKRLDTYGEVRKIQFEKQLAGLKIPKKSKKQTFKNNFNININKNDPNLTKVFSI